MTGMQQYGTCQFCWRLNASLQLASPESYAMVCSKCARTIQTVLGFLDFTRRPETDEKGHEGPGMTTESGKSQKSA